jgi:hypothetical protein
MVQYFIAIPHGITFLDWADNLFTDITNLNLPLAESEENWKEWAETLILDNDLTNVPLPENFNDWRIWAEYFIKNV